MAFKCLAYAIMAVLVLSPALAQPPGDSAAADAAGGLGAGLPVARP
jgi:hypothetical protein